MAAFAYIHCKPDGTPFYVGKGSLRRAKYLGERNAHHQNIVKKYGSKNIMKGMVECSTDDIAYMLEQGLIKVLTKMGIGLCNLTVGGEGGKSPTEETRLKLSEAAKKRGVSKACQDARNAALKGKALSEEHRIKLRIAQTGKVFSEEHRRNISISAKKRGMAACHAAKKAKMGI